MLCRAICHQATYVRYKKFSYLLDRYQEILFTQFEQWFPNNKVFNNEKFVYSARHICISN